MQVNAGNYPEASILDMIFCIELNAKTSQRLPSSLEISNSMFRADTDFGNIIVVGGIFLCIFLWSIV